MKQSDSIRLNIDHPNAGGAEAVLNSWEGALVLATAAANRYIFWSAPPGLQIELIFFDSQQEGFDYGKVHFDPVSPVHKWGMNGGLLYCITGPDEGIVGELAGGFAGRE
jgi:hypothetical protein